MIIPRANPTTNIINKAGIEAFKRVTLLTSKYKERVKKLEELEISETPAKKFELPLLLESFPSLDFIAKLIILDVEDTSPPKKPETTSPLVFPINRTKI